MTTEPVVSRWGRYPLDRIALCIGFCVVANSLLMGRAWFLPGDWSIAAIALPVSQCSVVALWAVTSQANPNLRFFLPPVAAIASWLVLTRLLPWGIGEAAAAAWAIALAVQTLTIVAGVKLFQIATGTKSANQWRFRFDLRTIILWTTVMALAFAFVRFGREKYQWTASVFEWEFFGAIPVVGSFNGLVAVLWAWVFVATSWRWRMSKFAITLCTIGSLSLLSSYFAHWLTGTNTLRVLPTLILAASQSVLIVSAVSVVKRDR